MDENEGKGKLNERHEQPRKTAAGKGKKRKKNECMSTGDSSMKARSGIRRATSHAGSATVARLKTALSKNYISRYRPD